jgi:hypothetical protein
MAIHHFKDVLLNEPLFDWRIAYSTPNSSQQIHCLGPPYILSSADIDISSESCQLNASRGFGCVGHP